MSGGANPARGEASFRIGDAAYVVRPSFAALVATEVELGPLLALVDRAAEGRLALAEMVALLWHCLHDRPANLSRDALGEALLDHGVGAALPALRMILRQMLSGST
jgi:hypothetical protein